MIATRMLDFLVCFLVAIAAYAGARSFVSIVSALLFCGCVGGAVYLALRLRREEE